MIRTNLKISIFLFLALSFFFFLSLILPINQYGIIPRERVGLWGIIFAPFLHGSLQHLLGNSFPLLFLLLILSRMSFAFYLKTFFFLTFTTNILVWLFAGEGIHIGASGIIFALTTFLIGHAIKTRAFGILIGLILFFLYYGNIFQGLVPQNLFLKNQISYSSHWLGMIVGVSLGMFDYFKKSK